MAIEVGDGQRDLGATIKVGGKATELAPVLVDGARTGLSFDLNGNLRVGANLTAATAVVSVALDGTGGTPDTVGLVGSTGNRLVVNADGSINTTGAASSGGTINDGVSAAIKATVFDYVNSNPIAVRSVDGNGDPASSGGTTQYAEDTPATAGEQIVMVGVVRNDVRGALVDLNGDRAELQVNASGDLRVDGSAVTQPVSGTFWQATQPVSAAALPLPAGAATSALQLPNSHDVTIDNAAGAAAVNVQDGGNSLTVDGVFFQATQPVSMTTRA